MPVVLNEYVRISLMLFLTLRYVPYIAEEKNRRTSTEPVNSDLTSSLSNANAAVDWSIPLVSRYMQDNRLDPLSIPDQVLWRMDYLGQLVLLEGRMVNLSGIQRSDDARATLVGSSMHLHLPLALQDLRFEYNYSSHMLTPFIGVEGKTVTRVALVRVMVQLCVDLRQRTLVLEYFEILETRGVTVHISGNQWLDWFSNAITNALVKYILNFYMEDIQEHVKTNIEWTFGEINQSVKQQMWFLF